MASKKARELGLREVYVHMGMFDFAVYCVAGDYGAGCKYAAWKFESPEFEDFAQGSNKGYIPRGKTLFRTGYTPIIWLPDAPQTPREHATLAHECLHAVYHMMDWASVPTIIETDEVVCHAMAHLVTRILEGLKNKEVKSGQKENGGSVSTKGQG